MYRPKTAGPFRALQGAPRNQRWPGSPHGQRATARAEGTGLQTADGNGVTCQLSLFRAKAPQRHFPGSVGTDVPSARLAGGRTASVGFARETGAETPR